MMTMMCSFVIDVYRLVFVSHFNNDYAMMLTLRRCDKVDADQINTERRQATPWDSECHRETKDIDDGSAEGDECVSVCE